ncbi:MAG: Uma2 family endonuclease [Alphaproteobacteria bacterium]|nr:Uma2 family endonuclease [Alphaproteobacteria bacterium]
MGKTALKRATYDTLLEVPEHLVAELIAGELYTSPRPAPRHGLASSRLGARLGGPFDFGDGGPGGWWVLDEPELHLGDPAPRSVVLVPDIAAWRKERMPELPDSAAFTLPPDWICEVLSPSTAPLDRARKLPIYGQAGVRWAWLVDPIARTLEVFRHTEQGWLLLGVHIGDAEVRAEPFDAVVLPLGSLWA